MLAHAVVENTKAQRGESGIPSWLKLSCMVLFVITCLFIMVVGVKSMNAMKNVESAELQDMYYGSNASDSDSVAVDTAAIDTTVW